MAVSVADAQLPSSLRIKAAKLLEKGRGRLSNRKDKCLTWHGAGKSQNSPATRPPMASIIVSCAFQS